MNNKQFNDQASSILAACLSQENIRVIHTKTDVASFDVKSRILRLPSTKVNTDKDVTIGLSLHEVGHALYTPTELSVILAEKKIPFNLVNIIEDVRIEKLIKRKYKGASRIMARAHLSLYKKGYYGTPEQINNSGALSILNAYYKVGAVSGLKLDPSFNSVYPLINSMETIEDVIEVCLLLKKKDEEIKEEKKKQEEENGLEETNEEKEDSKEFGDDDQDSEETSEETVSQPSNEESDEDGDDEAESTPDNSDPFADDSDEAGKEEDDGEADQSTASEETDEDGKASGETEDEKSDGDEAEGETESEIGDEAGDEKSNGLGDGDSQDKFDESVKDNVIDTDSYRDRVFYKNTTPELKELKEKNIVVDTKTFHAAIETAKAESFSGYQGDKAKERFDAHSLAYPEFISDVKRTVNHMANAFNRMQNAKKWARTKTHDKGTLDMRKLHQYKYNDSIFNKGQNVANGKNHGIVMMIDYSGSMQNVIAEELKQIIITAMFAKKVGIPFEAYSFTNGHNDNDYEHTYEQAEVPEIRQDTFSNLNVVELINASLKKQDFEKAIFNLFMTRFHYIRTPVAGKDWRGNATNYLQISPPYTRCSYECLSGTPLSASMLVIDKVIGGFVKKHNVEIPSFIIITDGAGNSFDTSYDGSGALAGIEDGNRFYEVSAKSSRYNGTSELKIINDIIKQKYNANIIGYFIGATNGDLKSGKRIYNVPEETLVTKATIKKKGFVSVPVESYDQFFFITGGETETEDYDTEKTDIKDIKKKFRANAKATTNSRVFVNEVISIIAKAA